MRVHLVQRTCFYRPNLLKHKKCSWGRAYRSWLALTWRNDCLLGCYCRLLNGWFYLMVEVDHYGREHRLQVGGFRFGCCGSAHHSLYCFGFLRKQMSFLMWLLSADESTAQGYLCFFV